MTIVAEDRIAVECFLDLLDNLIIGLSLLLLFASILSYKLVLLLPFILDLLFLITRLTALGFVLHTNCCPLHIRNVWKWLRYLSYS